MRERKRIMELTDDEYRTMLHCLIGFRNQLISEGRYTNAVDSLVMRSKHWWFLKLS